MKIKNNTIDAVLYKAIADAAFLKALLKNPEKACENAKPEKIVLSKDDMKKLIKSLTKKHSITGGQLLPFVHKLMKTAEISSSGIALPRWPPPGPWEIFFDTKTPVVVKPSVPKVDMPV